MEKLFLGYQISVTLSKRGKEGFGQENRQERTQVLNFQTALFSNLFFSWVYLRYEMISKFRPYAKCFVCYAAEIACSCLGREILAYVAEQPL